MTDVTSHEPDSVRLRRWGVDASTERGIERTIEPFTAEIAGFFDWDYDPEDQKLQRLYEMGKRLNWNASSDIDWSIEFPRSEAPHVAEANPYTGYEPYESMSEARKLEFAWHIHAWMCSQFLHGEQGALLVASQLVGCAPDFDAKLYAGSQTFDEARHVEVFGRYIRERIGLMYPVGESLRALLNRIVRDKRWHFKFIGMQLVVESLAMAAFSTLKAVNRDPVFHAIVEYVNRDEARHVAFGVNYMRRVVSTLDACEVAELAEFSLEACELMRDRLIPTDVFVQFGWDVERSRRHALETAIMQAFRVMLFERIVPNLKRVGLLTDGVRERYDQLGLLVFESAPPDGELE
jgi:hypothetical protein